MNKYIFLLLLIGAVSLFVSLEVDSKVSAGKTDLTFIVSTPTPEVFADVEKLELDRDEVTLPCPPGRRPPEGKTCGDDFMVKVKTFAVNPKKSELTYQYTVSGGRIIGRGAEVAWDLSGVRSGTYTITAAVDDGAGFFGKAQTETLRIRECGCGFADACPTIEVSTPYRSVKACETITFTVKTSGIPDSDAGSYSWTVSAGEIIEGQGTPQIKVKTDGQMAGGSVTAAVEISSDRIAGICETNASETVSITK